MAQVERCPDCRPTVLRGAALALGLVLAPVGAAMLAIALLGAVGTALEAARPAATAGAGAHSLYTGEFAAGGLALLALGLALCLGLERRAARRAVRDPVLRAPYRGTHAPRAACPEHSPR